MIMARLPYGVLVVLVFWPCVDTLRISKRDTVAEASVHEYLTQFGYMQSSADGAFALRTKESVQEAIAALQEFAGIPATGSLDERTQKLLRTPRCGLPDKNVQTSGRRKRYLLQGQKWPYVNLTWSLRSLNLQNLDPYQVRFAVKKALDVWAKHSRLTFREVDSDRADILIYFYRGPHGDSYPFDGKGVILAHAFFPSGGRSIDVHFDADEDWHTAPNDEGTSFFNVAAHEFGHSLGLSHSTVEGALMYPWYTQLTAGYDYELPEDDRLAIQELYGSRSRQWGPIKPLRTTTTTTTTTTTRAPRTHARPYNPRYPDGRYPYPNHPHDPKTPMHPDKKPHYPKHPDRHYPHKHPEKTTTTTTRRPDHRHHYHNREKETPSKKPDTCDTSFDAVAVIRREVFFFKDTYFWRIGDNGRLQPNYPAEIQRLWRGLPANLTHVDAVYERQDNKIVFFIDDLYYVFNGNLNLDYGYPKPLTHLGLPSTLRKIDGAMVWGHNGKTYLYSGSTYWRLDENEKEQKIELDYPRDMSMWKGVGTNIDAVFQWKDGKTYFFKGKGYWKFDDLRMRVEHEIQKSSGPFWMGCTSNLEGNDIGEKMPYRHSSASTFSSVIILVVLSVATLVPL